MKPIQSRCQVTGKPFIIPEAEQEHIHLLNGLLPHLKGQIPLPVIHPVESMRRIQSFINLFYLYRTKSVVSGKPTLTRYNPKLGTRVCTTEEFWQDEVDNTSAGQAYDFKRSFFEQYMNVYRKSIILPLVNVNCESSDFVNGAANVRYSYLCFNILDSENCLYCLNHHKGHDNLDCVGTSSCQYCYSCLDLENCYGCQHCKDCHNSSGLFCCHDCIGCHDCFGCVGLRNVRNHFHNQKYSPEEYQKLLKEQNLNSRSQRGLALENCLRFITAQNHSINHLINTEDCLGDHLKNSKNAYHCYISHNLEDCGYLVMSSDSNHCWRGIAIKSEYAYDGCPGFAAKDLYSYCNVGGEANILSFFLQQNCSHCFGCICLKRKSYCILNKQYSKEEYFDLVPRIVSQMESKGEWGTFFPPFCSPHTFKDSAISVFFEPLSDEEMIDRGYRDKMPDTPPVPEHFVTTSELPDLSKEIDSESLPGKPVRCPESGLFFKYQKQELQFYRKFSIPLPTLHWRIRLEKLYEQRHRVSDDI